MRHVNDSDAIYYAVLYPGMYNHCLFETNLKDDLISECVGTLIKNIQSESFAVVSSYFRKLPQWWRWITSGNIGEQTLPVDDDICVVGSVIERGHTRNIR